MLRNRIVSTPHATGWGRDGLIDPREVDYHVRKAAGGCALVMTFGSASVDPTTAASYGSIALWDERNEPALRALADGVHGHGARCISQMTHMGRRGTSTLTGIPLRAPSDVPEGVHLEVPVPLAVSEIPAIVQRFADAAARLERCGWDGCEVTSFGGHLIEQFFDPGVNTRTDAYGGSLENRTRFGREVLEAVRAAVSDDFIVGFRMAVDQCLTGGLGPDELIEVARSLAASGAIDLFSVSGGTGATRLSTAYFVPGDELPEGVYNERARRFREAVGVPVVVAGRNVEPAMADACVAGGVDLVAMTRAIIADPDLPAKARAGRAARPCIGLNEGCIGRLYTDRPMWCSVNPGIRDPELAELAPAATAGRIVVVGGGVAGLEAARAAALRGHGVVLFERRSQLGGRARLAGTRRGRERWARYVDWLQDEAEAAGAELRTGVAATVAASARRSAGCGDPRDGIGASAVCRAARAGAGDRRRRAARDRGPTGPTAVGAGARRRGRLPRADRCGAARRGGIHRRDRHHPSGRRRGDRSDAAAVRVPPPRARRRRDDAAPERRIERCRRRHAAQHLHRARRAARGRGPRRHRRLPPRRRRPPRPADRAAARVRLVVAGDALAPRTLLDAVAEGARAGADV